MKEGWRILQLKPHLLARNMSSTDLIRILKTVKGGLVVCVMGGQGVNGRIGEKAQDAEMSGSVVTS